MYYSRGINPGINKIQYRVHKRPILMGFIIRYGELFKSVEIKWIINKGFSDN